MAAILSRWGAPSAVADDIYQDVVLVTIDKARKGDIQHPEKLAALVHGIARNLFRKYRDELGRRSGDVDVDDGEFHSGDPGPLGESATHELGAVVRQLLESLPALDRELIVRHYLMDIDKDVTCKTLELTSAAYDARLSRARRHLRGVAEKVWGRWLL